MKREEEKTAEKVKPSVVYDDRNNELVWYSLGSCWP